MDYTTPNRLMNELLAEIEKSVVSSRLYISEDLLRRIGDDLKMSADNANDLVTELYKRYLDANAQGR